MKKNITRILPNYYCYYYTRYSSKFNVKKKSIECDSLKYGKNLRDNNKHLEIIFDIFCSRDSTRISYILKSVIISIRIDDINTVFTIINWENLFDEFSVQIHIYSFLSNKTLI